MECVGRSSNAGRPRPRARNVRNRPAHQICANRGRFAAAARYNPLRVGLDRVKALGDDSHSTDRNHRWRNRSRIRPGHTGPSDSALTARRLPRGRRPDRPAHSGLRGRPGLGPPASRGRRDPAHVRHGAAFLAGRFALRQRDRDSVRPYSDGLGDAARIDAGAADRLATRR
jgi:hypothetical protein